MDTRAAAIFDLDNTLISGQSQQHLLKFLYRQGRIGLWPYARLMLWFLFYKIGWVKEPEKIVEYAYSIFQGTKKEEFVSFLSNFYEQELKRYLRPEIVKLVEQHRAEGQQLILLSNSLEPLVKIVAEKVGIPHVVATELAESGDMFSGKINGRIVYGQQKVEKIKEYCQKNNCDLAQSWVYSDHISDQKLLAAAAHPVAVYTDQPSRSKRYFMLIFKSQQSQAKTKKRNRHKNTGRIQDILPQQC